MLMSLAALAAGGALLAEAAHVQSSDPAQLRREAKAMIAGANCTAACARNAQVLLVAAALKGDRIALVTLEGARLEGDEGAVSRDVIVAVEKRRAAGGDAVAAWRLVRRDESGEDIFASGDELIPMLKIAAEEKSYPRAQDAAYRLCSIYSEAGDRGAAKTWCAKAADRGHVAAAVIAARFSRGE
jgi:hypothetical protein